MNRTLFLPFAAISALVAMSFTVVLMGPLLGSFLLIAYGNYEVRGHQEFATNHVSQIKPAREMEHLYQDCRHYITYAGSSPLLNSVAYFGDRYELTMQVPVLIQDESSGAIYGTPIFHLVEVESVSVLPSGQVSVSSSRGMTFGISEWEKVYESNGNFSTIEFDVNSSPVSGFAKYVAACRPSN